MIEQCTTYLCLNADLVITLEWFKLVVITIFALTVVALFMNWLKNPDGRIF